MYIYLYFFLNVHQVEKKSYKNEDNLITMVISNYSHKIQ